MQLAKAMTPTDSFGWTNCLERGRRGRLLVAFTAGLALLAVSDAPAQGQRADAELSAELQRLREEHRLPGMVAATLYQGRIVRIGVAGVRKVGSPEKMEIGDQIHLGSCTKAMTATLLGTLVDQGRLQWSERLDQALPQMADAMHVDYRGVTVEQLLRHRAGLPKDDQRMFTLDAKLSETQMRRKLFEMVLANKPLHPPGSTFHYSNLGYMLAGLIAEEKTGQPWESLMRQRLFRPLGMSSAGFGPPGTAGLVDQPWGHRRLPLLGHRPLQADNPLVLGPAGRVHASISDWGRFLALHLNHPPRLLHPATLQRLHQPADGQSYAFGWGVHQRSWAGGNALAHSGSNTMWMALVWMAPQRDVALMAATNSGQSSAAKACDDAIVFMLKQHPATRQDVP